MEGGGEEARDQKSLEDGMFGQYFEMRLGMSYGEVLEERLGGYYQEARNQEILGGEDSLGYTLRLGW